MKTRKCSLCGLLKPESDFPKRKGRPGGLDYRCIPCSVIASRERHLKFRYGLSDKDYIVMYDKQKGLCAICNLPETSLDKKGSVKRMSIDHDHKTGKIRSLLCLGCNTGIGHFMDSPDRLRSAASYIESYWEPEEEKS